MKILFILISFISINLAAKPWVSYKNNLLTIENSVIRQVVSFKNKQIKVISKVDVATNNELINPSLENPYFEFGCNQKIIQSNGNYWNYIGYTTRAMINGGIEIKVSVSCNAIKGLQVILYYQLFPNSSLIRERMLITNNGNASIALTKINNKLHFIYPQYNYAFVADSVREIRMASFAQELIPYTVLTKAPDDRHYDNAIFFNLAHCHSFHPKNDLYSVPDSTKIRCKGPFNLVYFAKGSILSTYEHASQDSKRGFMEGNNRVGIANYSTTETKSNTMLYDQQQGVDDVSGFKLSDNDFRFIEFVNQNKNNGFSVYTQIIRGGYLDGEPILPGKTYETVWNANAYINSNEKELFVIQNYLRTQLCEHPKSRETHFYYNTWGMQRDASNTIGLRDIFTEQRILKEIEYAAELGVNLFVLDDGWEQTMGNWKPHDKRLPGGLKPLIDAMIKNNITPGIWLSPMGIDSILPRYKNNKQWVITDKNNLPIKAQWGFPAFDFVSDFSDLFIADCKALIDSGILFFKWDAINTFNSTLPNLNHGATNQTKEEIRDRYAYLLPFYVTRAMRELREYNPNVVIEIDITEPERCIIGLMPLQEGKLFWMNNGASAYNDFSHYRAKSMRTVMNLYAPIIPPELITYSNYPHNSYPFFAQRYNVNSSLIGGYGFWGNLDLMNKEQRERVKELVDLSKATLPFIMNTKMDVIGKVGASPEIYSQINAAKGVGQIIAFSGSAMKYEYKTIINKDSVLCVLRHAYSIDDQNNLHIPFHFLMPDDTREAFIIPNKGCKVTIVSSDVWIKNITHDEKQKKIIILPGESGKLCIKRNQIDNFEVIANKELTINY